MEMPSFSRERFSNLRGVRWRIDLGILPNSPSSIEEFRRVAADSRRRYVNLRRRLLIDPHLSKDESRFPDPSVENPLSQNPDSMWDRFFKNAELEKVLNQDLSRLYPELGEFFQTATCQSMLRQILLVWCLTYPQYGYRQGMHELLAPLLYVLQVDLQFFSQIRQLHETHFLNDFDDSSFKNKKDPKMMDLPSLDPETRDLFLLNDSYGAEGELGIILSDKFMEHDAFAMFDTLMNGSDGPVAIAEFYSLSPWIDSSSGLSPVREASLSVYHLLSVVDSSLHSHLSELGVEPQYFSLRWLRVLFGREFSLENLLIVWDEIFFCKNETPIGFVARDLEQFSRVLCSSRGIFVFSIAVAMLLNLRPLLLSSEHATTCLQRLLNFPTDVDLNKLIEKARSIHDFALDLYLVASDDKLISERKSGSLVGSNSPNFWEEKWRVFHETEGSRRNGDSIINKLRKGFLKEKENQNEKKERWDTIRHVILDDDDDDDDDDNNNNNNNDDDDNNNNNNNNNDDDDVKTEEFARDFGNNSNYENGSESSSNVEKQKEEKLNEEYNERNEESERDYQNAPGLEEVHKQIASSGSGLNGNNKCPYCEIGGNLETVDKELMATLRSLGQSMITNIQVIESVIEQDSDLATSSSRSTQNGGKEQRDKAMCALNELRNISSFLCEM